jgi:hypothetical protein
MNIMLISPSRAFPKVKLLAELLKLVIDEVPVVNVPFRKTELVVDAMSYLQTNIFQESSVTVLVDVTKLEVVPSLN